MLENRNNETLPIVYSMKPRWDSLCQKLSIPSIGFNEITNHYSESHRFYHNLNHINHCLNEFALVKSSLHIPEAVELAIWFHDIVYTIGNNDNEEKSAQIAKNFCQKNISTRAFAHQVESHILATKHVSLSENLDSQYLADIDMSILGQSPDVFDRYETQIRQEFIPYFSSSDYQNGRTNFFISLLDRPIYSTDFFRDKYESVARQNIQRLL